MRIAVLTGAGMSADSGIQTFRGAGGLWEGHRVEDVATPEAWLRDPALVLQFYNERRRGVLAAQSNRGHLALAELAQQHDVHIITQNIDDLHERAGSNKVLHLHGEIVKARSERNAGLIVDCRTDLHLGDLASDGAQLRPHIVWFGEMVPMMEPAIGIVEDADVILIIGTSMVVYPAASLFQYSKPQAPVFVINPEQPEMSRSARIQFITQRAVTGVDHFIQEILPAL